MDSRRKGNHFRSEETSDVEPVFLCFFSGMEAHGNLVMVGEEVAQNCSRAVDFLVKDKVIIYSLSCIPWSSVSFC